VPCKIALHLASSSLHLRSSERIGVRAASQSLSRDSCGVRTALSTALVAWVSSPASDSSRGWFGGGCAVPGIFVVAQILGDRLVRVVELVRGADNGATVARFDRALPTDGASSSVFHIAAHDNCGRSRGDQRDRSAACSDSSRLLPAIAPCVSGSWGGGPGSLWVLLCSGVGERLSALKLPIAVTSRPRLARTGGRGTIREAGTDDPELRLTAARAMRAPRILRQTTGGPIELEPTERRRIESHERLQATAMVETQPNCHAGSGDLHRDRLWFGAWGDWSPSHGSTACLSSCGSFWRTWEVCRDISFGSRRTRPGANGSCGCRAGSPSSRSPCSS
jgi:hypothetical protein